MKMLQARFDWACSWTVLSSAILVTSRKRTWKMFNQGSSSLRSPALIHNVKHYSRLQITIKIMINYAVMITSFVYILQMCFFCVWFDSAHTPFRSLSVLNRNDNLAILGCYKLKATSGVKTTLPAWARRCIKSSNLSPFSYYLLLLRRDKRWLQFWRINSYSQLLSHESV
jgi:hypothetical protein